MVFGGIFSLSLRRSLLGCTRQGDADQGTGELGDVAGVLTVLVDGNAARSGTKGEGSAGAGGDTCDEGEAAAASDLAGSRDAHLEGVAQGVVIRGGVLGEGGVTGEGLAYAGPAVGDGDQDLFASPFRAADDVVVGLDGSVGPERGATMLGSVSADLREHRADGYSLAQPVALVLQDLRNALDDTGDLLLGVEVYELLQRSRVVPAAFFERSHVGVRTQPVPEE